MKASAGVTEHHIRSRRDTRSRDAISVRNTLPFLELDVISRDNMCKESLDFIDRKESSGTDGKCSLDVETD